MKFEAVSLEEFPNAREAHRGRISGPILKGFLESMLPAAKLDRTDVGRTANHLKMLLGHHIKNRGLPIKLVTRQGELYFIRLDIGQDGQPGDPEWKPEGLLPPPPPDAPGLMETFATPAAAAVAPAATVAAVIPPKRAKAVA